jgi:hypothetical protein
MPLSALLILYLVDRAYPKTPIKLAAPQAMVLSYGAPTALIATPIVFYAVGAHRVLEGTHHLRSHSSIYDYPCYATPSYKYPRGLRVAPGV